jgi:3-oxoacyl-[acyl-carrier-protein] synthase III
VQARREFYAVHGRSSLKEAANDRVSTSLRTALEEVGLEPDDSRIRVVVTLWVGPRLIDVMYHDALGEPLLFKTIYLGGRTGHRGAGDMLANMTDVVEQRMIEPGEYVVILGCGFGFTWSTAVVQAV